MEHPNHHVWVCSESFSLGLVDFVHLCSSILPCLLVLLGPLDLTFRIGQLQESQLSVWVAVNGKGKGSKLTMYFLRSSSFSRWNRFISFRTLALASFTS